MKPGPPCSVIFYLLASFFLPLQVQNPPTPQLPRQVEERAHAPLVTPKSSGQGIWIDQSNAPASKPPNATTSTGPDDFHLKAGKVYEDLHLWKEAESEYLKAASDKSPSDQALALQGLSRVRGQPQPFSLRLSQILKASGIYALTAVGMVIGIYVIILTGLAFHRSIQCMEVRAFASEGDDKLGGLITVTFARLRGAISDTLFWHGIARSRGSGAVNFPVVLPDLRDAIPFEEQLPDVEIEAGGVKFSKLTRLIPLLFRPRFRLVGAAASTEYYAIVHAEIWERQWWFGYRLIAVKTKRIPRPPNGDGFVELEIFVYDVLLAVMYATY